MLHEEVLVRPGRRYRVGRFRGGRLGTDYHDHDRDHHDHDRVVIEHDRGNHEGWYHRGGSVPPEYRDHRYVVNDWRTYHLHEPPRGYQWVRSDNGDFLLVAAATGVITDLIINSH